MNIGGFFEVLRRRWWVILAAVVLAVSAGAAYAAQQRHVYESTATEYVRLSAKSTSDTQSVISGEVGLLSYGSLVNTLVSIAESRVTLGQAAAGLQLRPGRLDRYRPIVTLRPQTFVLDISVDGPSRELVVALANRLAATVASTTAAQYPVFGLSSLAPATAAVQVRPKFKRDLVYGGVAGLLIGLVLATLRFPSRPTTTVELATDPPPAAPDARPA